MKHRIGKRCDDFYSAHAGAPRQILHFATSVTQHVLKRLSPLRGVRIKVRGFQVTRVHMRTFTLALSLEKGEAN
jgi:hypothetical protein